MASAGTVRDESLVLEAWAGRGFLMDVAFRGGRSPHREVDFLCAVPGVTGFGGFVTKGSVGLLELAQRPLGCVVSECSGRLLRQDSQWPRAESKAFWRHLWQSNANSA